MCVRVVRASERVCAERERERDRQTEKETDRYPVILCLSARIILAFLRLFYLPDMSSIFGVMSEREREREGERERHCCGKMNRKP